MYYNWNRYYDPQLGRYITSDPIGLQGGVNTYGYVKANPLRWIDSTGLVITGSWIQRPKLADYDIDFNGIDLGERFDIRGFPPGLSVANANFSYTGLVQGVVYCVDDDECNPRRWMISPSRGFSGDFEYRIWITPLPNAIGAALTIANLGLEALDVAKYLYEDVYSEAQALLAVGPTALCRASGGPN